MPEIKKELLNQDNKATDNPLFVVYELEKIPADSRYTDNWEYYDTEDHHGRIGTTKDSLIEHAKNCNYELPPDVDNLDADDLFDYMERYEGEAWIKYYYIVRKVFVTVFFTQKAADRYIENNKHNLTEPFVYVHSLYGNPEMIALRNMLMEGCKCQKEEK